MAAVKVSQKEYLRKYLSEKKGSGASEKKKKKKNHKFGTKTVKIIDDDEYNGTAKNMRPLEEGEFEIFNNTEDAPLIVGVVDERGPVDFADKSRWKIIADDGEGNVTCRRASAPAPTPSDNSRARICSPDRVEEVAPPTIASDGDLSPPRRSSEHQKSPQFQGERRFDSSPPRGTKKRRSHRASSESDQSPPRRRKNDEEDSDIDPPRRSNEASRKDRGGHSRGFSPGRDSSPRRYRRQHGYHGHHRRHHHHHHRDEKSQREDKSPRRSRWNEDRGAASPKSPVNRDSRMKKTLDGKTAGLQDARALRIETDEHKKREADLFKRMSTEVSGRGQATVLRDRRTGRKRDLGAEAAERREKEQRQAEIDEKYAKWGRGLKQVDDQAEKRQRDLYEMSKPLARYANDVDLDRELREAEREGDTMLEEIKKRQIKEGKRKPDVPSSNIHHQAFCVPNRFGIKPGHRWDGVDRSNGYEKKWFEARNARTALAEEAYKWSTADM